MGDMRQRLRTSHMRLVMQRPVPFKPDVASPVIPNFWKPSVTVKEKEMQLRVPSNNLIRAVASTTAKETRYDRNIARMDKVVRTYCGVALGYFDRGQQVEEFIYLELRRAADARKQSIEDLREQRRELRQSLEQFHGHLELRSRPARRIKRKLAEVQREINLRDVHGDGVPVIGWRRWLEVQAERVFNELKDYLLNMAQNGRVLRKANHADYDVVMGHVKNRPSQKIFLIVNAEEHGPVIMALKTSREYRRNLRRGRNNGQDYNNRPQMRRRNGARNRSLNIAS